MADASHPAILICQMKGGAVGIDLNSIYSIIPDLNKPKSHSVIYLEGMDEGLLVEGSSSDIISQWSQQLFWRDAIQDYLNADNDDDESDTYGESTD